MISIFQYTDPVIYLNDVILANKSTRGFISKLAEAANCQVSYLSQFLKNKNNLSPDQIIGISDFLHLNSYESEFLLNLLLLQRAGTAKLKDKLNAKLESLREQQESITNRINNQKHEKLHLQKYYSSWLYGAIHMLISIPEFANETALAKRLHILPENVFRILSELEQMGLIRHANKNWTITEHQLHLPRESEMTYYNHFNWRQRALVDIEKNEKSSVHYSSAFALSKNDAEILKRMILDFIEKTRQHISPSEPEEAHSLNIDYFKI